MQGCEHTEHRRKRLVWRACHRGIREMDLVIGTFVKANIDLFTQAELDDLERILEIADQDLLSWMTGTIAIPEEQRSDLLERILATAFDERTIRHLT